MDYEEAENVKCNFKEKFGRDPDILVRTSGRVNIIGEHIDYMGYSVMPTTINRYMHCAVSKKPSNTYADDNGNSIYMSQNNNRTNVDKNISAKILDDEAFILKIANYDNEAYPLYTFEKYEDVRIDEAQHKWPDYIIAAYVGFFEYLYFKRNIQYIGELYNIFVKRRKTNMHETNSQQDKKREEVKEETVLQNDEEKEKPNDKHVKETNGSDPSLDADEKIIEKNVFDSFVKTMPNNLIFFIHGNIPQSAGLSSSSSLMVCAMFCMFCLFKETITKQKFAELCAKAERYVGVQGGGMDQAVITYSDEFVNNINHIYKINMQNYFFKKIDVKLKIRIFILNTFVCSSKANEDSSKKNYNKRVLECKLAAMFLLLKLNLLERFCEEKNLQEITLKDAQTYSNKSLNDCVDLVKVKIEQRKYLRDELCGIFGAINLGKLLANRKLHSIWEQENEYNLFNRALHVFSEALRVDKFVAILEDPNLLEEKKINLLGEIMNESNSSLHNLYECGCEELKDLSAASNALQDEGNKLTGAGWGGCIVSFVREDRAERFVEGMRKYFAENKYGHFKGKSFEEFCFSVHSAKGTKNVIGSDVFV